MRVPHPRLAPRLILPTAILVVALLVGQAQATPGDLDPAFGSAGIARTEFPGRYPEHPLAVVLQPDGKIVAVGTEASGGGGVGIVRYLPDGTLDGSFGNGGLVATGFPDPGVQIGIAAALQADGKLVVLFYGFGVLRFNPDGSLDDSFADHGRLRLLIDGHRVTSAAIAVQPDGKILILGNTNPPYPEPPLFVLVRLDDVGTTEMVIRGSSVGRSLALQPDGKILVGGDRLTRFHPDGTLDELFGIDGELAGANAYKLAVNADGRVTALCSGTCIERFTAAGTFDTSFGDGGRASIALDQLAIDTSYVGLFGLASQPDGRSVAVGRSSDQPFVARFDRNGRLDPSFGLGGVLVVPGVSNGFSDVALQPDAKVVAVGGYYTFVAARFLGDVCGDGVQQLGEACDDGNLVDGDGCDSNCTPTACGNGVATAGEECDDGNLVGGDCCGPSCTSEALGSPCDDGDACTLGDSCQYGTCSAGAPRDCDDGDACTHDDCDPFAGLCRHEPSTDLVCPSALKRLDWFRKIWSRGSGVPDAEPHFGEQTVLAGDRLFVLARGEFYGANVQILDRATGTLLHAITNQTPDGELSEMGPIAALGNDLVVVNTAPSANGYEPPGPVTVDIYDGATFERRQQLVDPTPDTAWGWWSGTIVHAVADYVLVFDFHDRAIYVFDPTSGDLVHTLRPPPPEDTTEFGYPIVELGSNVFVQGSGVVHLFDVASGELLRTFADPTPGRGRFGDTIAPYGPDVLIGGSREDAVYLFDAATGDILRVFADPDHVDRRFGTSIAVVGTDVVVGRGTGRVHVFDGDGRFRRTILDPGPSSRGCFGFLLPVLGDKLAVSDPCASNGPYAREDEVGVVYVFDPATGDLIGVIPDEDAEYRDQLYAVLAYDRTILTHTYDDHSGGLQTYTSCIDGVVEAGEECDDGNYVNGDGCDDNCTVTRCGNGLPTGDESCDDGNLVDDDECSNQCRSNICGDGVLRRYWEQCDDGAANGTETSCCTTWCGFRGDGAACTIAAVCGGAGVCAGDTCVPTSGPCWPCGACDPERGCVAAPATDCRPSRAPRQSSLMIERHADPARARLAWRWRKGAATPADAFGQPATRDSYGFCLYDESQAAPQLLLSASIPPLGYCRGQKPCWRSSSHGALFRYRDTQGAADGLATIDLTPGDDGHAQVVVTARGKNLHLPPLPLTSPVRVQLRASNGECWEQTYSADGMGRNGPTRFRATGN